MPDKETFTVPIILTIHGHVLVKANNIEESEDVVRNMSTSRLRRFFQEKFCFSSVASIHNDQTDEPRQLIKIHG